MSRTFYLDLDRTLFQTDRAHEIFAAIAKKYPERAKIAHGYDERSLYYVYPFLDEGDSVTYFHDVTRWLGDNELDAEEVYAWLAQSTMADGRFEYEGTKSLIEFLKQYGEVKILTFGDDAYQRAKAALCPSLRGIEVLTTLRPKGEYLTHHGRTGDWLLDDKKVHSLPKGTQLLQIDHTGKVCGVDVVGSLMGAKDQFKKLIEIN